MLSGLQTNAEWKDVDYALIRPTLLHPPQFTSAKVYQTHGTRHNEGEIDTLRGVGIRHFIMRLGDSMYEPDSRHPHKWWRDPVGYAEDCLRTIGRFTKVGVLDYILDNEPNITHTQAGHTAQEYALWLLEVIGYIRDRNWRDGWDLPPNARLFAPPIAWTDEYPHMPWLEALADAFTEFAGLAVHSYWQSSRVGREAILAGPMRWERFGANYEWYAEQYPGKPIMISEYGNSIHEQGKHTAEQVEAFRMEQYPLWLEFARRCPQVEAAHVFISAGCTPDWRGFAITPSVARAMRG